MGEKRRKKPAELLQKPKGGNGNASDASDAVSGKEPEGEARSSRAEDQERPVEGRGAGFDEEVDRAPVGAGSSSRGEER
ncbi:MAG TPA: hypothetical protein VKF32_04585 [Thermoanaerobaculia bacterium]|nr:hypothetical protein [Thermoanaerobaculia bacterium]